MSIHSLIEMSRRSLTTMQAGMNVVGQNIANANTDNYARRKIVLKADAGVSPGLFMRNPENSFSGRGVSIDRVERVRDEMLAKAHWEARGSLGSASEDQRLVGALEGLFPAAGEGSLGDLLDGFWGAWMDVADNPTDLGVRKALRTNADALTATLNRLDGEVQSLQEETRVSLQTSVEQFNEKLEELAKLNAEVSNAQNAGKPNFAAEDRRDLLTQELADMAPLRVTTKGTNGYNIVVGGVTVLEGSNFMPLTFDNQNDTLTFGATGIDFPTRAGADGAIGAQFRALSSTSVRVREQLDQLAEGLVRNVNAMHRTAVDANGAALGVDFFDYAAGPPEVGVSAATIRLSDAILADAGQIAPTGFFSPAGESVALEIANLRVTNLAETDSDTAENFVIGLMSELGAEVNAADAQMTRQAAVTEHLQALEKGASGVSIDEEMTQMIKYQHAYSAAAKVLTVADEMLQTVLNI